MSNQPKDHKRSGSALSGQAPSAKKSDATPNGKINTDNDFSNNEVDPVEGIAIDPNDVEYEYDEEDYGEEETEP